jgi:hypothetical protein
MEDRIPLCGEVPALVCPVRPLLAAGPGGARPLSPRLDPPDSPSDRGYCRRWCDRTLTQRRHASRKTDEWTARPLTPASQHVVGHDVNQKTWRRRGGRSPTYPRTLTSFRAIFGVELALMSHGAVPHSRRPNQLVSFSRRTSDGRLSSRTPTNRECRRSPSAVHSTNVSPAQPVPKEYPPVWHECREQRGLWRCRRRIPELRPASLRTKIKTRTRDTAEVGSEHSVNVV